jgi:SAM-dependent methyltransferase
MKERFETDYPNTGTMEDVRKFYDGHPYPPPVDSLDQYRKMWGNEDLRRADHYLTWPSVRYRDNHDILVAGCGTSQAAKHAMRWPAARVIGIDVSATSVRHTQELKRKYNLDNLEVYHLPIDRIGELSKTFDQIVCTGVLHHLPNPDVGLTALRNVLRPEGAMHLMLYAPYGRAGIYLLQEFCRRVGITASDVGIRDLKIALKALPRDHPLQRLLAEAPDFANDAALADALLNPQDRAYSVPQIFDFLGAAQLTFGRWIKQAPYNPRCGVMSQISQLGQLAELSPPEQYAAVELFRGTMSRHSFIAYRNDSPQVMAVINFSGSDWLRYVPIRMADTISVRDRVPPEYAAVLINRSHTYRDIIMPLDSEELRLFEAIDGVSPIGDIIERAHGGSQQPLLECARVCFERLWCYDQVVFDASHI